MLTYDSKRLDGGCSRLGLQLGILILASGAALLAGCAPRRSEIPHPTPSVEPARAPIPAGSEPYDIVAGSGGLTLYVRRAGPLARLGHNHVITSSQVTGQVWLGRETGESGFELRIPVASFLVDDPADRAAAGPDFAGAVPAEAREGTYDNLLRPEVLDAARYPEIVVRSVDVSGSWDRPLATVEATLKDVTRRIEVPLDLQRSAGALEARGSFQLRQTDFGLTPFSVAGGAIQVADEVEIRFDLIARRR
jgi:hypothetical protein